MRRKELKILVESCCKRNDFLSFRKKLPQDFIKFTCNSAVKLVKYLNLTMSVEAFDYIFIKFTKSDYSTFLRFYNDNKEKNNKKMNVFCTYIKDEIEKKFNIISKKKKTGTLCFK